jgi:hypothetical protein
VCVCVKEGRGGQSGDEDVGCTSRGVVMAVVLHGDSCGEGSGGGGGDNSDGGDCMVVVECQEGWLVG